MRRIVLALLVTLLTMTLPVTMLAGPPGPPPGHPPTATETACQLLGAPGIHSNGNLTILSIVPTGAGAIVTVQIANGARIVASLTFDLAPPFEGCAVTLPGIGTVFVSVAELTVVPPPAQ